MSVVSFRVGAPPGQPWYLDAGSALGQKSGDVQCAALTTVNAPQDGADNIWNLTISWDATTHVARATISDATSAKYAGPTMLQLIWDATSLEYRGAVQGREATDTTVWSIVARGPMNDVLALPVSLRRVMQNGEAGAQDCYLTQMTQQEASKTAGRFVVDPLTAQQWTLRAFGDSVPPAAYLNVQVAPGVTAQQMLKAIWNKCVGTDWASMFAPTLIAWLYDYPKWWPANPQAPNGVNPRWAADLTAKLYTPIYVPWCVNNEPVGFGTGSPPEADPPPFKGGHGGQGRGRGHNA